MLIMAVVVFGAGFLCARAVADPKADIEAAKSVLAEKDKQLQQAENDLSAAQKEIKRLRGLTGKTSEQTKELKTLRLQVASQKKQISALKAEIEELKKQLAELQKQRGQNPSPTPLDTSGYVWHPSAKCQITNWSFNPGDKAVVLSLTFKNGKTVEVKAPKKRTGGDEYFLVTNLPAGLQLVVPGDDIETWVVNCDNRSGWVKMIQDPSNIAESKLSDANDHKEGNGKTFTSGEAIILVKQSGMTIRPPVY